MLPVCCSNSLLYTRARPTLRAAPMYRVSKLPVIHVRICAPPVSVAYHNRESVDYIADTTLRFLSSVSPYLLWFHSFQIRAVVINSQVNLRYVTVPVTPCVVLSLNTSLMSQSSTFTTSVYQSNLCAKSTQSIPDISTKNTHVTVMSGNCTPNPLEYLRVHILPWPVFFSVFHLVLLSPVYAQ